MGITFTKSKAQSVYKKYYSMGTVANEVTESMGQSKRTRISSHTVWTVIYDDKKNI